MLPSYLASPLHIKLLLPTCHPVLGVGASDGQAEEGPYEPIASATVTACSGSELFVTAPNLLAVRAVMGKSKMDLTYLCQLSRLLHAMAHSFM
jgi:hypothetical protein